MKISTFRTKIFLILLIIIVGTFYNQNYEAHGKENVIKIGVLGPFSGSGAEWGGYIYRPVALWADDINKSGGISVGGVKYTFKVVTGDSKFAPAETLTQARKMIYDEKVQFIVGPITSGPSQAIQPLCEKNKISYFSWSADPNLGPENNYTFQNYIVEIEYLMRFLAIKSNYPNLKTLAYLGADTSSGHWYGDSTKKICEKLQIKQIGQDLYPSDTSDFYPILTKIKKINPDMIALYAFEGPTVAIMRQAKELKIDSVFVHAFPVSLPTMAKNSSWETIDGLIINNYDGKGQGWDSFIDRHKQKFNIEPGLASASYTACEAFLEAIKKAGSVEKEKVNMVLRDPNFKFHSNLYGEEVKFYGEEVHKVSRMLGVPIKIVQAKDGKIIELVVGKSTEQVYNDAVKWWQK